MSNKRRFFSGEQREVAGLKKFPPTPDNTRTVKLITGAPIRRENLHPQGTRR